MMTQSFPCRSVFWLLVCFSVLMGCISLHALAEKRYYRVSQLNSEGQDAGLNETGLIVIKATATGSDKDRIDKVTVTPDRGSQTMVASTVDIDAAEDGTGKSFIKSTDRWRARAKPLWEALAGTPSLTALQSRIIFEQRIYIPMPMLVSKDYVAIYPLLVVAGSPELNASQCAQFAVESVGCINCNCPACSPDKTSSSSSSGQQEFLCHSGCDCEEDERGEEDEEEQKSKCRDTGLGCVNSKRVKGIVILTKDHTSVAEIQLTLPDDIKLKVQFSDEEIPPGSLF